jgi:hypothetical protein
MATEEPDYITLLDSTPSDWGGIFILVLDDTSYKSTSAGLYYPIEYKKTEVEPETYQPDYRLLSKHLRGLIRSKGVKQVNKIRHVTRSAI